MNTKLNWFYGICRLRPTRSDVPKKASSLPRFSKGAALSLFLLLGLSPWSSTPASADDDSLEVDMMDYDAIVRELNTATSPGARSRARVSPDTSDDPLATVLFHGGVGFASTLERIRHAGQRIDMHQQGIQAAFGIDLFSDHWLAEGTARSFGGADYGKYNISLKEFDLKLYYRDRIGPKLGLRLGAGLSARYLRVIDSPRQAGFVYTTPSSVAVIGMEFFVVPGLSIGAELSSRNALIAETSDRNAADATLRLDTHF